MPGFEAHVWFALLAPRGVPKQVLDMINAATLKVMGTPEMKEMLRKQGFDEFVGSPDELRTYLASETARWGDAVRHSGAKVQ